MAVAPSLAARRLQLTAGEYAYLVGLAEATMPTGWEPAADVERGDEQATLAERGVLRGSGDLVTVHPSVAVNIRILTAPQVLIDTTVAIGGQGAHSVHAVAGQFGAALFRLAEAGIELSMFPAVGLGQELLRAVPAEQLSSISSALHAPAPPAPHGRVPLAALRELGLTEVFSGADPDAGAAVLDTLNLPEAQRELAIQTARRTDGTLRSVVTGRLDDRVAVGQVIWLHTDAGWVGLRPDPTGLDEQIVLVEPVTRDDFGAWLAPYISEVLA
jgi:hypothetical protein